MNNKDRRRDTRAGLERELNILFDNKGIAGSGRQYPESRGVKQGPNGRLDLNGFVSDGTHAETHRTAKLRITA